MLEVKNYCLKIPHVEELVRQFKKSYGDVSETAKKPKEKKQKQMEIAAAKKIAADAAAAERTAAEKTAARQASASKAAVAKTMIPPCAAVVVSGVAKVALCGAVGVAQEQSPLHDATRHHEVETLEIQAFEERPDE